MEPSRNIEHRAAAYTIGKLWALRGVPAKATDKPAPSDAPQLFMRKAKAKPRYNPVTVPTLTGTDDVLDALVVRLSHARSDREDINRILAREILLILSICAEKQAGGPKSCQP